MKDDIRYTPSDCFRTFPFSANFETDVDLEAAGENYHTYRAQLMVDRNEGLTRIYNRFHARDEGSADIVRLRTLHSEMDAMVLRAYGGNEGKSDLNVWNDLAKGATPEFVEQDADEGKPPKTRLDWPAEFKDEVLTQLLALNAERATGLIADVADDEESEEVDA
jgi:hypothetical protein